MSANMTASEAAARMASVTEDCTRAFGDMGLRTECAVTYYDAMFNQVSEEKARHIHASLTVFADGEEDAPGYTIEMSAECKGGKVDERELYTSFANFDASVEETVGAIHRGDDPSEVIRALCIEAEAEYKALIKRFNIMKIGVAIAAVLAFAVVILTLIF